jgi:hypothetical protein
VYFKTRNITKRNEKRNFMKLKVNNGHKIQRNKQILNPGRVRQEPGPTQNKKKVCEIQK